MSAVRDDLRMAVVTDPEIVKKFKKKYGPKMFDEFSQNSYVVTFAPG